MVTANKNLTYFITYFRLNGFVYNNGGLISRFPPLGSESLGSCTRVFALNQRKRDKNYRLEILYFVFVTLFHVLSCREGIPLLSFP